MCGPKVDKPRIFILPGQQTKSVMAILLGWRTQLFIRIHIVPLGCKIKLNAIIVEPGDLYMKKPQQHWNSRINLVAPMKRGNYYAKKKHEDQRPSSRIKRTQWTMNQLEHCTRWTMKNRETAQYIGIKGSTYTIGRRGPTEASLYMCMYTYYVKVWHDQTMCSIYTLLWCNWTSTFGQYSCI